MQALAETSAALRDSVRGRFVHPDSFHVTLAFIGELESHRISDAAAALACACRARKAFEVELADLGCFGKRSKATLWQGFRNGENLEALARDVRAGLKREGIGYDGKSFRAHVTLMRNADLTSGLLPTPLPAKGTIRNVSLFQSDLSGPHPVYDPLATETLGSSPILE